MGGYRKIMTSGRDWQTPPHLASWASSPSRFMWAPSILFVFPSAIAMIPYTFTASHKYTLQIVTDGRIFFSGVFNGWNDWICVNSFHSLDLVDQTIHTQMIIFLNQNENDNFSSVSQGNFQNRESLFNSFGIIKSNQDYFTMLYNCGWILKLY